MYVETHKSSCKGKDTYYVRLRMSYRANGKVLKKTIERIGSAPAGPELERLQQAAAQRKRQLEEAAQPAPLVGLPETVLTASLEARREPPVTGTIKDFAALRQIDELPLGVFEVFGPLFDELKLNQVLGHRPKKDRKVFRQAVLMRLLQPGRSKLAVSRFLNAHREEDMPVHAFYRMMDALTPACIQDLKQRIGDACQDAFDHDLTAVLVDVTTLVMRSEVEDSLRRRGLSKDHRPDKSQVVLALLQTTDGLPLTYQLFPGNTQDVSTLVPLFAQWQRDYRVARAVVVADAGMASKANLQALTEAGFHWVVAARLRRLTKTQQQQLAAWDARDELLDINVNERRLVVRWDRSHAARDAAKRTQLLERLRAEIRQSGQPRTRGRRKRYLTATDQPGYVLDDAKIAFDTQMDGLHRVWTNLPHDVSAQAVRDAYRGLWQIEANFRVLKHDLKIRPIFHFTPRRIEAHIAICFAAFGLLRLLMFRLQRCPEVTSDARLLELVAQCRHTLLEHGVSGERYVVAQTLQPVHKAIYKAVEVTPVEHTVKLKAQHAQLNVNTVI